MKKEPRQTIPPPIAAAVTGIARRMAYMHTLIYAGRIALKKIIEADIHHPSCVIDNCRPSCPIRIANEELKRPLTPPPMIHVKETTH